MIIEKKSTIKKTLQWNIRNIVMITIKYLALFPLQNLYYWSLFKYSIVITSLPIVFLFQYLWCCHNLFCFFASHYFWSLLKYFLQKTLLSLKNFKGVYFCWRSKKFGFHFFLILSILLPTIGIFVQCLNDNLLNRTLFFSFSLFFLFLFSFFFFFVLFLFFFLSFSFVFSLFLFHLFSLFSLVFCLSLSFLFFLFVFGYFAFDIKKPLGFLFFSQNWLYHLDH